MGATTSSIAAKLAFFPPESSYKIDIDEQTGKLKLVGVPEGEKAEVSKLQTKKGHSITVVYVRNISAKLTVLYSHGNAADIGQMFKFLTELYDELCVNVMGLVHSSCIKHTHLYSIYLISWTDWFEFLVLDLGMTMLAMGNPQERCGVHSIENFIIFGDFNFVYICLTWLRSIIYSNNFTKL